MRLDVGSWHQPNLMPEIDQNPNPMMSRGARRYSNLAGWQFIEEEYRHF
jgi:hypothetical protein